MAKKHIDYRKLKAKAKKQLAAAKKKFKAAEKKVEVYTKTNPKKALAIAAGVGAAIGAATIAVMRRRRK